jgi:hypothetical protein
MTARRTAFGRTAFQPTAFEHAATFGRPVGEVFAWHERPGALARLAPPWQPARVVQEAASLRDGLAVLGLPGGVQWRARHLPEGYDPGRRFTDVLVTPLLKDVVSWRHEHVFTEAPGGGTTITDHVDSRVPAGALRAMFAYRTRQLGGDLAAHQRWPAPGGRPVTVAITGASGLVGSALAALLTTGGHKVIALARRPAGGTSRRWQPEAPDPGLLDGVDALVHLAGASIAGRFTDQHKQAVRDSRVGPTRRLAELAARSGVPAFVAASAIGIYGPDRGDEYLSEGSERGGGFLADLVADWEAATGPARDAGTRVVNVRTGIVQSPRGGVLRVLRPPFQAGLGGPLGDGRAWMSWIGIDDLTDIYLRAIVDPGIEGPVNATAPAPVRNAGYTAALAAALRRPALLPVPALGPRLLLGDEGATEFALASQRALPARLTAAGHPFRHPAIGPALGHLLGRTPDADGSASEAG